MPRKTINVELMRTEVNTMLKDSTCGPEERQGMIGVLETLLHKSGNYHGFQYLAPEHVPKDHKPGMNRVDYSIESTGTSDEIYKLRFKDTDKTRVRYF